MPDDAPRPDRDPPGAGPSDAELDVHGTEDATLGGYLRVHERPPAFQGPDDHPYTVSIEVERTPDLVHPWVGYLVFPRWARTGLGITGHVETPLLWKGTAREEVIRRAGTTPLLRVKELLDEAVRRAGTGDPPAKPP